MKQNKKLLALLLVLVIAFTSLALVACNKGGDKGGDQAKKVVRISTTTSVNDSGLMAYLQPYFKADTGYDWEISSAGTGAAIAAATYGNADVILVHSKNPRKLSYRKVLLASLTDISRNACRSCTTTLYLSAPMTILPALKARLRSKRRSQTSKTELIRLFPAVIRAAPTTKKLPCGPVER